MRPALMTFALFFLLASPAWPQAEPPSSSAGPTPDKGRYANMPPEAVPFRRFSKPYHEWFVDKETLAYYGAASDRHDGDVNKLSEVAFGFLGPLQNNPEWVYGVPMLHGAQLAIEEANERGGYKGKPYTLKVYNDSALWGASSTVLPSMLFKDNVWAILGSIDGQSTHILIRVSLKLEVPILAPGTTDRTVNETRIPWLVDTFPDDRIQGYALAQQVFKELDLKRIGVIRTQTRYARIGVGIFNDLARRLGRQPVLEVKFDRGDKDFARQLQMLKAARLDGIVLWGEAPEAGLILKQMREMGMKQPVFASSRVAYQQTLDLAGPAAEGLVVACAMDPTRNDSKWTAFRSKFRERYGSDPDPYATYAYDGIHLLVAAIERGGLNRGRIMEALRELQLQDYQGAAGLYHFDRTLNNIAPITLARVRDGKFEYCTPPTTEEPEETGATRKQ